MSADSNGKTRYFLVMTHDTVCFALPPPLFSWHCQPGFCCSTYSGQEVHCFATTTQMREGVSLPNDSLHEPAGPPRRHFGSQCSSFVVDSSSSVLAQFPECFRHGMCTFGMVNWTPDRERGPSRTDTFPNSTAPTDVDIPQAALRIFWHVRKRCWWGFFAISAFTTASEFPVVGSCLRMWTSALCTCIDLAFSGQLRSTWNTTILWTQNKFDSTLGYPGEGPVCSVCLSSDTDVHCICNRGNRNSGAPVGPPRQANGPYARGGVLDDVPHTIHVHNTFLEIPDPSAGSSRRALRPAFTDGDMPLPASGAHTGDGRDDLTAAAIFTSAHSDDSLIADLGALMDVDDPPPSQAAGLTPGASGASAPASGGGPSSSVYVSPADPAPGVSPPPADVSLSRNPRRSAQTRSLDQRVQ